MRLNSLVMVTRSHTTEPAGMTSNHMENFEYLGAEITSSGKYLENIKNRMKKIKIRFDEKK